MFNVAKTRDDKLFLVLKHSRIAVTEQDIQKARENDPETLYKIGDIYYKKREYKKAFPWFHKAALQNHSGAQAKVGEMYRRGGGVSKDYRQAMDWSMKAASAGNARGQYLVGDLYSYGHGVPEDNKQAMNWYLKAANNGYTDAILSIGYMYRHGQGATKNIPTAIEWYTKVANQGNAIAQYYLGYIYETEDEVKDLQKAANWFQKAADNGDEDAEEEVKELNKQGYYAKEEEQEEEKTREEDAATTNIANDQSQSSITTSTNDDHLEKTFQSKTTLIEGNNDALKNELAALRQKELQQDQENKQLRDELTKLKVATEDSINNDLNYDSSDNDGDDNTETADVGVMQESEDALQNKLAALKQKELEQHEENQRLKEKLARMETEMQDNADNDLNYDSSVNESDNEVDINPDYEYSDSKEEEDDKDVENTQQPLPILPNMDESHADPNYNSSDNKDPRNDIYYD